jgi:hypothetical protein
LLNEKYPDKKERNLKKKLVIRDKSLEGDLDLRDFVSLEYLNCENNYLTSLDIRGLVNLKEIYCGNNRLTSENFYIDNLINVEYFSCRRNSLSNLDSLLNYLNPEKLVSLRLLSNNFTADDLNCFSKFVNLNNLGIGNYLDSNNLSKEVARNIFSGSLKPLKDLKKLKKLSINDTLIEKD